VDATQASEAQRRRAKSPADVRILGIETTCDETAAAVFTGEPRVLAGAVASQARLHAAFGGVVPEMASRAHLERLPPILVQTLADARTTFDELDAVAVAYKPGLVGSILVGLTAAKTLAATLDVPLLGFDHLEAHLFACQMQRRESVFPCIGLVASGGHTHLFQCRSAEDMRLVGATIDDAAGEAFDKAAALLGLGYPGGPAIEMTAAFGDPKRFRFPRAFLHDERLDFSFSGLKTALRYALFGQNAQVVAGTLDPQVVADAAASFQQAVVDVLVVKSLAACRRFGATRLCVGGGVAANAALRTRLESAAAEVGVETVIPPLSWCTDNAAMAAVAVTRYWRGESDPLDLDAVPGLIRR
jgi:N6-L-threonylcarbamoyladenine synthase